jgi:hypothetical protein
MRRRRVFMRSQDFDVRIGATITEPTAMIRARLLMEHRQIEALADRILAALEPSEPKQDAVAEARWALAKVIVQHVAYEDRAVCLPLEQHERPDVAAVAKGLKAHLLGTQAEFTAHTARWTTAAMVADWHGYRRATRHQLDVLCARIAREERELFPLIELLESGAAPHAAERNWARDAWTVRAALDTH